MRSTSNCCFLLEEAYQKARFFCIVPCAVLPRIRIECTAWYCDFPDRTNRQKKEIYDWCIVYLLPWASEFHIEEQTDMFVPEMVELQRYFNGFANSTMTKTKRGDCGTWKKDCRKGRRKSKCVLLPGAKGPCASVIPPAPNVIKVPGRKHCLPVLINSLSIEEEETINARQTLGTAMDGNPLFV